MQQSYIRALFHQKQFSHENSHFGSLWDGRWLMSSLLLTKSLRFWKDLPRQESNPGRLGVRRSSYPIHYGRWLINAIIIGRLYISCYS